MGKNTILRTFILRFRQFGGWKVFIAYAKMGALWPVINTIIRHPFNRKTYRRAYSAGMKKVEPYLKDKFTPILKQRKTYYSLQRLEHGRRKTVWFCWLQGLSKAPALIKACYNSLCDNLPKDYEIEVIDDTNWRDYVELPVYIIKRWEEKQIPPALFYNFLYEQ